MNESPAPAVPPPANSDAANAPFNWSSPFFIWPVAAALAVLLYFGGAYLVDAFTHEATDDAFIAARIVSIAPQISGQVAAVHVRDNELVRANDLLLEIDPADYAITVAQKKSAADAQAANVQTLFAADALMRKKVTTAEAGARKARADAAASAAAANLAAANLARDESLLQDRTISQQEFDAAQAADKSAQADLVSAQANAAVAVSKVDEAGSQLAAAEAEVGLAKAQWDESQTNVAAAQLSLSYAKIFAPAAGRVTRKAVEAGDYVQAGQQLLALVPAEVWVVANFKESQLKKMQTNQPVRVAIDALGGKAFRGHVDSVQAGSGAAFSLLPPENATGNFVKVVQRVPVKIVFDEPLPAGHVIGPGLSVTARVRVSPFTVPDWATALAAILLAFAAAILFRFITSRQTNAE